MGRWRMKYHSALVGVGVLMVVASVLARNPDGSSKPVRVALVKMPYVGERNLPDTSRGPDYLEEGGIRKLLEQQGVQV